MQMKLDFTMLEFLSAEKNLYSKVLNVGMAKPITLYMYKHTDIHLKTKKMMTSLGI